MRVPKATRSKDGRHRLTVKVDHRVSAYDMATFVTAVQWPDDDTDPEAWADEQIKRGVRALLEDVRDALTHKGDERPFYEISDEDREPWRDALMDRLPKLFPGLD